MRRWRAIGRNSRPTAKDAITVRQLLSHQAGLPAIRKPLPDGAALDWNVIVKALAEQAPWWRPGSGHGYHVNTFGFLTGELVRRIDGRSIGTLLREDVARPLGADIHIGLPRQRTRPRLRIPVARQSAPP